MDSVTEDADACSIGKCNSGVCVPGPTVGCNDGNECTDDSCDPNRGGCVGVNDDTNPCSDGNACTTVEHCGGGICIAGTAAVNCDDANECTADSCDPNTGCAHIQKSCNDRNACTSDACDPQTGGCISTLTNCTDADPCTVSSGGDASSGGAATNAGSSNGGGFTDDGGCGCRVVSAPRSGTLPGSLAFLVGLATLRRRRSKARSSEPTLRRAPSRYPGARRATGAAEGRTPPRNACS